MFPGESRIDAIELAVPAEIGRELSADGIGMLSVASRSTDLLEVVGLAFEATAVMIGVIVSRDELLAVVRRVVGRAREQQPEQPTITVQVKLGNRAEAVIDVNTDDGQRRVEVRVLALIDSDAT